MTVDDRDEKTPGDQDPTARPAGGGEPTVDLPPSGEPRPEDPRGPQSPRADEAPTQPLSGVSGPQAGAGAPPQARRLVRLRGNRIFGGVCAGLGRYFNTDPVFFRIAAVVLAFIGGAGVLLYLAALLLIPNEDAAGAEAVAAGPNEGRNRGLVIVGVVALLLVGWPFLLGAGFIVGGILVPLAVLVVAGVLVWWLVSGEGPSGDAGDIARRAALGIGILLLCGAVAVGGAWAAAAGGETVVAILVIGTGLAIAAGAFLRPVRWLVLPALALALSAGVVSASGIDLDGGVGERTYRPDSTDELRDRYELGLGELTVDLRDADLPPGDTPLGVKLGVGSAQVIVPEGVCVATTADVGVGNVRFFRDENNGGVDVDFDERPDAPTGASRVVVDAELGVGELRVGQNLDFPDEAGFDRRDLYDQYAGSNDACLETGASARG